MFAGAGVSLGLDEVNGGSESDTADFTHLSTYLWMDLASAGVEAWTQQGSTWVQLANLASVENITGSAFGDQIWADSAANVIKSGAGNDIIYGRGGADELTGGASADSFTFLIGDSGQVAGSLDNITDFTIGAAGIGDRLDFAALLSIGGNGTAATQNEASGLTRKSGGTSDSIIATGGLHDEQAETRIYAGV